LKTRRLALLDQLAGGSTTDTMTNPERRALQSLRVRAAASRLLGPVRLVHAWRLGADAQKDHAYNAQTMRVMQRQLREGSCCLDVGAHVGATLLQMVACAPRGTHYAFEPLPEPFAVLRRRFGGVPSVRLYNAAAGQTSGTASFNHVLARPEMSGFLRRGGLTEADDVRSIDVDVVALDDVIPADQTVDFVKVDVEGAELLVFRGALATLARCRPTIVFEHGPYGADVYEPQPSAALYDLLVGQCGLQIYVMATWLSGGPNLSKQELIRSFHEGAEFYYMACANRR
jgi:FkbM family methyltransferase